MTLYRKHRPQRFEDLIGQNRVRSTLVSEIESDSIAHAYLFVGPRGIGKTTTARILAKAVNCTGRKGAEPDNTCTSCRTMNEGRSLDLVEIDAASHTQVDHVRENILPAARTAPSIGTYKVFIIDEVHMLSVSAFNALLKMLEEPPAHALFILATTEPHRVPETIISRCQRFDFRRVGVDDIVTRLERLARLEKASIERSVFERIARASDGSLRDAENLLGILLGLGDKKITDELVDLVVPRSNFDSAISIVESIVHKRTLEGLQSVQRLVDEGVRMSHFMREIVELLRGLVVLAYGNADALPPLSKEDIARARLIVNLVQPNMMVVMLDRFLVRERDMRMTFIPQLPLELAIVELTVSASNDHQSRDGKTEPSNQRPAYKQQGSPSSSVRPSHRSTIDILSHWPKILETIAATNPSVTSLLKTATPYGIVNEALTLSFPYGFHSERAMEPRNRRLIEKVLSSVTGTSISINAVTSKQDATATNMTSQQGVPVGDRQTGHVWQEAVNAFGAGLSTENEHP